MIRVVLRVKDKSNLKQLETYGNIIYVSPILNVIAMEIKENQYSILSSDDNVIRIDTEDEGSLLVFS
jgi:uncharacterized protein YlbG (UPF0298 family)